MTRVKFIDCKMYSKRMARRFHGIPSGGGTHVDCAAAALCLDVWDARCHRLLLCSCRLCACRDRHVRAMCLRRVVGRYPIIILPTLVHCTRGSRDPETYILVFGICFTTHANVAITEPA